MSIYYSALKNLAKSNSDERLPCNGNDQIQQWYAIVLNQSYHEIRIFAKDLSWLNNLFILDLLYKFLYTPWTSVKILLKEDCDLSFLGPIFNLKNLEVKIAKGSYALADAKEFTVVDDRCFRFEAQPDFGIINFNNFDDSFKLIDAFDQAFKFGLVKDVKKVETNNE
jgi:hypothetical protein